MKDRADYLPIGAKESSLKIAIKFNILAINFTNHFNSEGYIVLSKDCYVQEFSLVTTSSPDFTA
jgi:hypothetical protein